MVVLFTGNALEVEDSPGMVWADKRRITIHGEHFKLDELATQWWDDYDAQNESYWTTQIYTNTKKGISATIQFDYRKRVRAVLEYPDGR